jgi:CheY-like chemotaxis protein
MKKAHPYVLVVQDYDIEREVIEGFLQGLPFDLHFVSTCKDCLAAIASHQPDVILFEAARRGLDGRDVCREADIPMVFLSTLDIDQEQRACFTQPHHRYLTKPYSPNDLIGSVSQLLFGNAANELTQSV